LAVVGLQPLAQKGARTVGIGRLAVELAIGVEQLGDARQVEHGAAADLGGPSVVHAR
jgi:hypothetical protein